MCENSINKTITLINFVQSTVGTRHSAIVQNMNLAAGLGVGVGAGVGMGLAVADLPHLDRHGADYNKIYCQRPIIQHTDCLNTSVLDCSVTFMVDKNICLLGVQVRWQYFCTISNQFSTLNFQRLHIENHFVQSYFLKFLDRLTIIYFLHFSILPNNFIESIGNSFLKR